MTAETLLERLAAVRQTGPGSWIARCPAHFDKRPSLSVRELPDGVVLIHCFAGCGASDVVEAVGLEFADLYPPREAFEPGTNRPRPRRPAFDALAALHALTHELLVIAIIADQVAREAALDEDRHARLRLAIGRVCSALEAVGADRADRRSAA